MNLIQLSNKVAGLAQQFQNLILLGKRFEEFPLIENVNPLSRILVSTNGTTEALQLQTLLDAVSNETQNNKVREGILGTITPEYTLENILDNTGLLVDPDEIVILSVFEAIDSSSDIQQFKQRLFLWKLGKGNFGPIGSDNIDSKLFELPSIFPTEETADEIISAPNAIVRDYGIVSTDILTTINTKSPAVSFNETSEDVTFIYYVRVTIEGVKYLYQFKGVNGVYGQGASQMENEDLVLIFSSSNSGPVNNYAFVTKSSLGETVINTTENNFILPENGKSIYNITATGNQVVIGKNKNYLGEATSETVPLGMELKVINSTGSILSFAHNNSDPNIKPVITPDGQTFEAAPASVISFIERADSIMICAYSKASGGGVTQTYVDTKDLEIFEEAVNYAEEMDAANLVLAKNYANSQDIITLANAENYADTKDIVNLNAAKAYADSLILSSDDLYKKRQHWCAVGETTMNRFGVTLNYPEAYVGTRIINDGGPAYNNRTRQVRESAATVGSSAEIYTGQDGVRFASFTYGFRFICDFNWSGTSGMAVYAGIIYSGAAKGNIEPSTQTNCIGIGADSTDVNLQIMHNDGLGVCTKIDLGNGFPATFSDDFFYRLILKTNPNSRIVNYEVLRFTKQTINGVPVLDIFDKKVNGIISTDLSTGSGANDKFSWDIWACNRNLTSSVRASVSQVIFER